MPSSKRILLIITGSIAAYKSLELIRLLTKAGAEVEAALTKGGKEFVTRLSVETLTGRKAHVEMWDEDAYQMNHIELSRNSDLIVAAPATADFIAKMIRGEGNDLATTVMLAKNRPVILAPSMNVEMWENPAFQRNLETARADGAIIVPPQVDELACGEVGIGKMAEPETIFESIVEFFETAHARWQTCDRHRRRNHRADRHRRVYKQLLLGQARQGHRHSPRQSGSQSIAGRRGQLFKDRITSQSGNHLC